MAPATVIYRLPSSVIIRATSVVGPTLLFVGSDAAFYIPTLCPMLAYQIWLRQPDAATTWRRLAADHGFEDWCESQEIELEAQTGPFYRVGLRDDDDAFLLRMRWY